jgi:hypothetical protein
VTNQTESMIAGHTVFWGGGGEIPIRSVSVLQTQGADQEARQLITSEPKPNVIVVHLISENPSSVRKGTDRFAQSGATATPQSRLQRFVTEAAGKNLINPLQPKTKRKWVFASAFRHFLWISF